MNNDYQYHHYQDICDCLLDLTDNHESIPGIELDNALRWLKCAAENELNADYFRVLYLALSLITDKHGINVPF